ncbi:hypothetical protein GCM10027280_33590 [Micromonospora polyrhachis]
MVAQEALGQGEAFLVVQQRALFPDDAGGDVCRIRFSSCVTRAGVASKCAGAHSHGHAPEAARS